MKETNAFTKLQLTTLVVLRFLIGWHLLYEGISKLTNATWSSSGFLKESQWIFSGIANFILSNDTVLSAVDFLNTWGLIAIGLGLIFGLFAKVASYSGALLLLIYYLNNAPITGIEYSVPSEGNYLIISKTIIEAVALVVLAVFPTSNIFGLDMFIYRNKK